MKYVERIAKINQAKRKNAILEILQQMNVDFRLQRATVNSHEIENIVVSFNPSNTRIVVGAHWDSVENSTGANDNASSCSVLLHLIENLKNTQRSIDFVFFDREECEEHDEHGSTMYLSEVGRESISAMINLDMCGHGDNIVISDKGNCDSPLFFKALCADTLQKHQVNTVVYLPNGDDDRFDEANIPNISVCTLGADDLAFFRHLSSVILAGEQPTQEDYNQFLALDVVSTMHLAPNDNISAVNQYSVDIVVNWLTDGLK